MGCRLPVVVVLLVMPMVGDYDLNGLYLNMGAVS